MSPLLAALRGPATVRNELARWISDITSSELIDGVVAAARTPADCLLGIDQLRHRVGMAPVPPLSPLVEVRTDLPVSEELRRLVSLRLLARDLKVAAEDGPDPVEPLLLRAPLQYLLSCEFGRLAGYAYAGVWAWNGGQHATFDMLAAWAGSEWGEGSGRWRMLELTSTVGRRRSAGELWRTSNGALLVLHRHNDKRTAARPGTVDAREPGGPVDDGSQRRPRRRLVAGEDKLNVPRHPATHGAQLR